MFYKFEVNLFGFIPVSTLEVLGIHTLLISNTITSGFSTSWFHSFTLQPFKAINFVSFCKITVFFLYNQVELIVYLFKSYLYRIFYFSPKWIWRYLLAKKHIFQLWIWWSVILLKERKTENFSLLLDKVVNHITPLLGISNL